MNEYASSQLAVYDQDAEVSTLAEAAANCWSPNHAGDINRMAAGSLYINERGRNDELRCTSGSDERGIEEAGRGTLTQAMLHGNVTTTKSNNGVSDDNTARADPMSPEVLAAQTFQMKATKESKASAEAAGQSKRESAHHKSNESLMRWSTNSALIRFKPRLEEFSRDRDLRLKQRLIKE